MVVILSSGVLPRQHSLHLRVAPSGRMTTIILEISQPYDLAQAFSYIHEDSALFMFQFRQNSGLK